MDILAQKTDPSFTSSVQPFAPETICLPTKNHSTKMDPANGNKGALGTLDLELNGRRYQARWANSSDVEHLRVNLRVESGHNGSGKKHIETLDLFSPRSRKVFASRAASIFEESAEVFEEDLSELLISVDNAQRSQQQTHMQPPKSSQPILTALEKQEAVALLKSPDLMDQISMDMDTLGYVGEKINKKLGYLIAVSRKLPEPLSAIIISQSGAGKSGLASVLEKLVPPEETVFWSRLTPQALYYVEKDFLKRKLIVIEEREGSEAADYSIRSLQSKHKLVQAVPLKDPATGTIRTQTMEVEGPAAFLETTTRLHINPENASRCFELYLDESPAQTERVHQAQRVAKTMEGLKCRERARKIEHLHQNAQRLLKPMPVVIPYASLLTFPNAWLRTRRDNLRLLNLIEAVAFLNQMQRARKSSPSGVEYIEANVDDYAIAYSLAAQVLGFGFDELRKPARDLHALIEKKVKDLSDKQGERPTTLKFTRREVREWSGLPNHQVKSAMQELEELEYVEVQRAQRGSRYTYQLARGGDIPRSPLTGLLSPIELYNRVNQAVEQKMSLHRRSKVEKSRKKVVSTPKLKQKSMKSKS